MWQDWVISGVQLVLILSLLPTVFHPTHKPEFSSAALTTVCLFTFALTYATLQFWFSTVLSSVLGLLWLTLAVQRYRLNKETRELSN